MKQLAFIFCVLLSTPLCAATYYVKNGGNDTNDGLSDSTAWASLHAAVTKAADGDTILLKRGSTWLVTARARATDANPPGDGCVVGIGLVISDSSAAGCQGAIDSDITVDAYGTGAKPIIDASAQQDAGLAIQFPQYAPLNLFSNDGGLNISNLDLRGPRDGPVVMMHYSSGAGVALSYSDITGAGWTSESMIVSSGSNHNFSYNSFDAAAATLEHYGKTVEQRGGSNITFYSNTFRGFCQGGAIRFSNGGTGGLIDGNYFKKGESRCTDEWAMVIRSTSGGVYIMRNNVVDLTDSNNDGANLRGFVFWGDDAGAGTIRKIFNNTFIGKGDGYAIHQGGDQNWLHNNIFYDLQVGVNNELGNTISRNNIWYNIGNVVDGSFDLEVGSDYANPNLANPSMSNQQATDADLTVTSTNAIDGSDMSDSDVPADDWSRALRSAVADIGAFEYGEGEPLPPPGLGPVRGIHLSPIIKRIP